ncbi:MAG: hypothetical protein WEG36_01190 [Gemmatimonadota bacterium]
MRHSIEVARPTALVTGALLSLAAILPSGVEAQQPGPEASELELNRMHDESIAVVGSTGRFFDELIVAAAQHGAVADLRTESDPMTFACLSTQAALLEGIGDLEGAVEYSIRAANHARITGDALSAANGYIDAAVLLAQAPERNAQAVNLIDVARMMARSPSLNAEERATVLSRIGGPERVAAAW